MPQNFTTTFIPQGGGVPTGIPEPTPSAGDIRVRQTVSIMTVIAVLAVLVAVLSIAGVFLLEKSLTQRISQMETQLETAEKQFEPTLIVQLKELDERLNQASNVLRAHRSVAPFFEMLNASTSKNVQYDALRFEMNEDNVATVTIEGQGRSYQAIAQQSKKLAEERIIQDHIFSEFELQDTGRVRFSLLLTLSPEALLFENVIQERAVGESAPVDVPVTNQPSENSSSLDTNIFISS